MTTESTTVHIPSSMSALQISFVFWSLSCVIINCFFTTAMFAVLTYPGFEPQITCVEDVIKSSLPLRVHYLYVFIFIFLI